MRIPQFAMERMQSTWENLVDYNLSESGVHPMRLEELVEDQADRAGLLGQELVYQSQGFVLLHVGHGFYEWVTHRRSFLGQGAALLRGRARLSSACGLTIQDVSTVRNRPV